jgi:glucose/arabinose dehydrogenase
MRTRLIAAAALLCVHTSPAVADFSFTDFSATPDVLLVGNAAVQGTSARIARSTRSVVGAMWHTSKQPLADGFTTTFTVRFTGQNNGGGEGLAFVIQNSAAAAIGGQGCQLGYDPIANSLAVELDTRLTASCQVGTIGDPDGNHVSIHTRGQLTNSAIESNSRGRTSAIPPLADGNLHTVKVTYDTAVMAVFVDDLDTPALEVAIDLDTLLSLDNAITPAAGAWIGFTAATGAATQNADITSWSFEQGSSGPGSGNRRPATPTITEPSFEGRIVNPADVHMETAPFSDLDADAHLCTDWEIWTVTPSEVVWRTSCISGVERVHTHLGDGDFLNSHLGRRDLFPDTQYRLRARHRDSSGDPSTEWSFWSTRGFRTDVSGTVFPLLLKDVELPPGITWTSDAGSPIALPTGAIPATLTLDSDRGGIFGTITGGPAGNTFADEPTKTEFYNLKLVLRTGSQPVSLPRSLLTILDSNCAWRTLYLPQLAAAANQTIELWVSENGSTYTGASTDTHPKFETLRRGSLYPWISRDPNFVVERFATGFQLPVNITMVNNPGTAPSDLLCYVAELYGSIRTVNRDGTIGTFATDLINFNPTGDFPGSGEQGLADVAIDPATGDLYATMLYSSNPADEQAPHYPKVVRFTSTDGGRTAATQTTILDMAGEIQGQSHQISSIQFGPDGKLYVHMGDGFDGSTPQNLESFRGKILRMELNGQPCTDNPFYNASNGITARDYVFAYGVRNPFGGTFRGSDARLYFVENGPTIDRLGRVLPGRNFGFSGSDGGMLPFATYNWSPAHAPVNIAFIQNQTFGGSGFPTSKLDRAFVTESGPTYASGPQILGKRISEFQIDATGVLVSGPTTLVDYTGSGRGTAVALAAGPDGLYFSDLYKDVDALTPIDAGSTIFRIRYAVPADCNSNLVPDYCEIARGTVPDINANGIPDTCEPGCAADFNADGFVDFFDFDDFVNCFEGDVCPPGKTADFNNDGFLDFFDFDDFIIAFETGC